MTLYTIGFTKKTAREFFSCIEKNKIEMLIDIRLNNKSQLAGFTKGEDLSFFLARMCNCLYNHCEEFAPSKELLTAYQDKSIDWVEYEKRYNSLLKSRNDYTDFTNRFSLYERVVLLCSEPTADRCHRRLLAELINGENPNVIIQHL